MTYSLLIGDRSYSSWSLRGWLLFAKFGISCEVVETRLYDDQFLEDLKGFAPSRTVPCVKTESGAVVFDSLALAETLNDAHPDAGMWPADRDQRILARNLAAEMHSSYTSLRGTHPMNLRKSFKDVEVSEGVQTDLDRIEYLWSLAMKNHDGPWLFGDYSVADAFFAPVATRIATYGLPVGKNAQTYIETTISDPVFMEWRKIGLTQAPQPTYDQPYKDLPWPGPD
jgi:glutathione S-transferase